MRITSFLFICAVILGVLDALPSALRNDDTTEDSDHGMTGMTHSPDHTHDHNTDHDHDHATDHDHPTDHPMHTDHDHTDHDHGHTDHDHGHTDGGHEGHPTDGPGHGGGHSMKMYFHHTSHATILFKGWHTMTYWDLFGSCLAVMVMAALYEGYKSMREHILRKSLPTPITSPSSSKYASTVGLAMDEAVKDEGIPYFSKVHVVQSLLHMGQVFISYCLMLVFMTYNIWLCLFVVLGAGLGYFAFARDRSSPVTDLNEHCN